MEEYTTLLILHEFGERSIFYMERIEKGKSFMENRKRFPFEISGFVDQRGMTGMEAVYDREWMGEDEESEQSEVPVPQYHPHVPPCYRKKSGEKESPKPCPCQGKRFDMILPDPETQYFMNMYPEKMSRIQRTVEEECDKMDYEGSLMYDEYPDRNLIKRISRNIYEILLDDDMLAEGVVVDSNAWEVESDEDQLQETGIFFPNNGSRPPMGSEKPGRPGRPPHPPMKPWPHRPPVKPGCGCCHGKDSWLKEAVDVLLMEEMQRRRRRR